MSNKHQIIKVHGHYEAYDEFGNFVCSGDNYNECEQDLIDYIVSMTKERIKEEYATLIA